jgi:3-deoxy-manno-octulosonate cytidylyltransferase (CMP-KDO synthetase)
MLKESTAIVIPTRMHATRLPGKIHQLIGDKPMIFHVIDKALLTGVKYIIVAVDNLEHYELVSSYKKNILVVMTSTEHQSGTDRVYEAITKLSLQDIKYIINVQGDMPFIDPESILLSLDLLANENIDISTLATKITDEHEVTDPNVVKIAISHNKKALYFSRCPIPHNAKIHHHHLGVYAFKEDMLKKFVNLPVSNLEKIERLEQLRALENDMTIGVAEINDIPISVDTAYDLEKANKFYQTINKRT